MSGTFGSDHFAPTHMLFLTENDRASWSLTTLREEGVGPITWIPFSPATIVDDAMLMVAVHVFQDEGVLEGASRLVTGIAGERVDLNTAAHGSELGPVYERCRALRWGCSIVVTVLAGSSLRPLLAVFDRYPFDVRVCREDGAPDDESMPFVPEDTTLPFFAYGLFKPGEPLHPHVEPFLEDRPMPGRVRGWLLIRDGLPILKDDSIGTVDGYVIRFRPGEGADGYAAVGSREPLKQYRWKTVELTEPAGLRTNVLVGRLLANGSVDYEGTEWRSGDDAVLRDGLALVRRIADEHGARPFESAPPEAFEWERLFRLQMAYLFLWTVIERYAALAYGPDLEPGRKVKALGVDPLFGEILSSTTNRSHRLFDSRDPSDPVRLDAGNPRSSARYYFQVRNNLTHRGKGAWKDGEIVRLSLLELLTIVERMVEQTPGLRAREPSPGE